MATTSTPSPTQHLDEDLALGAELTWSARHLRGSNRRVQTWGHARSLLSLVGTTDWPWLIVHGDGRLVYCQGFADILTVEVGASAVDSGSGHQWRVGRRHSSVDWVFLDTCAVGSPRVRRAQVLTLTEASVVLYDWLGTGRLPGFDLEEL
jgi:hypothetical protein